MSAERRRPGGRVRRRLVPIAALVCAAAAAWAPPVRAGAVRYRMQPEATELTFTATSRLMDAEGRFHRLTGDVVVDPADLATARVTLSVEAASVDTGIGMRDNHLRSEDFLDARRFPLITFESARVEVAGRRAVVYGRLTLHGVTREIGIPVDVALSPVAMVATGEVVINRRDYGITYQSFLNPIGNDVRIRFTVRARAA